MTNFNENPPLSEENELSQAYVYENETDIPAEYALSPEETDGVSATSYAVAAASSSSPPAQDQQFLAAQQEKWHKGAGWFYWIAGLSLINTALSMLQVGLVFIVGLGVTMFIDAFANELGGIGKIIAIVFNFMVLGCFILLGVFSHRGHRWAFITGIILYGLDTLIMAALVLLDPTMILALGFHVWVLWNLIQGLKAMGQCKRIQTI